MKDAGAPLHLNAANLVLPALAVEGAEREALQMARLLHDLSGMFPAILRGDRQAMAEARQTRTALEHLGVAVRDYLAAVDPDALTEAACARIREVFTFVTNIERAGSALEGGLFRRVSRAIRSGGAFTPAVSNRLCIMMQQLQDNLIAATSVFSSKDLGIARLLAAEKQVFRDYEAEALLTSLPFLRRDAVGEESASIPIEVLGEFRSVNGHLVASSANAVLKAEGELLSSRVVSGATARAATCG